MAERLTETAWLRLTGQERRRLRTAAVEDGVAEGALVRALVLYGLDHRDHHAVRAAIHTEQAASLARRQAGGRKGAAKRWGTGGGDDG